MRLVSNKEDTDFIPSTLYNQITKCLPIVSVEAVIVVGQSLLLLRRCNEPALGQWWFPGGRIKKGESLEEALHREVKEETGLELTDYKLINVYSRVFPERHDITIVYVCKCKESQIVLNKEHSEFKLFKKANKDFHPFILQTIKDSQMEKV
jgi:colanic acid biosynthesis protein WcaH